MTTEELNSLKEMIDIEGDLNIYIMIKSKQFKNNEILEMGAYLAAHYIINFKNDRKKITETDKNEICNYLFDFYNRNLSVGISDSAKDVITTKFYELINNWSSIIQYSIITEYLKNIMTIGYESNLINKEIVAKHYEKFLKFDQ
jgi:hypothetical protein